MELEQTLESGSATARVYWPKPKYSCASGGEVTDEKTEVQPAVTSPHAFSWGKHVITYTYNLNGGVTFQCPVVINIRGECMIAMYV